VTRKGNWIQTYSGKQYWPIDPRPEDVNIEDVAHALSMLCRFGGHCLRFYSVAEHSVHIARWLLARHGAHVALCGLLHDSTEAYVADVPSPTKPHLSGYKEIEARNWSEISWKFSLPLTIPREVKEADARILADEISQNMAPCIVPWSYEPAPLGVSLEFWDPERAELEFLAAFRELSRILCQQAAA